MRRTCAALASGLTVAACGTAAPHTAPVLPPAADRPIHNGPVTRACGSHHAEEFDVGMESRVITAGNVALAPFRISPKPEQTWPIRVFKLAVRLDTGADATIRTTTASTSLGYDRARFNKENRYQLTDGDQSVRFTGCPTHPALFMGTVYTSGPRTLDLIITTDGQQIPRTVTAFTG